MTAYIIWAIGFLFLSGYTTKESQGLSVWENLIRSLLMLLIWPILVGFELYEIVNKKDENESREG